VPWFRLILLVGILALLGAVLGMQTPTARAGADVAILRTTVTDPTGNGRTPSWEAQQATAAGLTWEYLTPTQWAAKSTADFAAYKAIVLGDNTCSGVSDVAPAVTNKSTWGPAITGNVIVVGTDPTYHATYFPGNGSLTSGPATLIKNGIGFAASQAGKTGAYISLSCYYHGVAANTPVPLLDAFTPGGFTVQGVGCFNNAHIVATHPSLTGLTDASLSGWSCSVHEAFDKWPADFQVLAIAQGAGSMRVPTTFSSSPTVPLRSRSASTYVVLASSQVRWESSTSR